MSSSVSSQAELPSPTRRNWVWFSFQFVLRLVFTFWLRYRASGLEKIPKTGGALFIVNHQSYLDPLLVGLPLRRPVSYLARDSLFPIPIVGWIVKNTYVMPLSREAASSSSIKEAVRRMKHGFLVGIFPEGTRTPDGSVHEFKPGFIAVVRRSKVPVYPVGIAGAYEAFPRGCWFLRPGKVRVVFGKPIPMEELDQLTKRGREDELVARIHQAVSACHQKAESLRN